MNYHNNYNMILTRLTFNLFRFLWNLNYRCSTKDTDDIEELKEDSQARCFNCIITEKIDELYELLN